MTTFTTKMKALSCLIACLALMTPLCAAAAETITGRASVVDGDTIDIGVNAGVKTDQAAE